MARDSHTIAEVTYREERIVCACGVAVTALPDISAPEAHTPLAAAWRDHRRRHGLRTPTIAQLGNLRRVDPDTPWSTWRAKGAGARSATSGAATDRPSDRGSPRIR